MMALEKLRQIAADDKLTAGDVFDLIFKAGSELNDTERECTESLEISIRLLDALEKGQVPDSCYEAIQHLAEECGLYPYLDDENFGLITQTIISAHTVALEGPIKLHSKQMEILLWLLAGDNVVLSAPTSFGKTLLVDAFVSKKRPHCVVMIMPTIALIDETRRRLNRTFGFEYQYITTSSDAYEPSLPAIFILTQERFLTRNDELSIDFLFVDEFYKLDPSRDDGRFERLNLALYRALPNSKQSFLAGPHINRIELGENWSGNFRFVKTDFRTVTVNVIDRTGGDDRLSSFLKDLESVKGQSSLVFAKSPQSARTLVEEIIKLKLPSESNISSQLGHWIAGNYHNDWTVAEGTQTGVAIHHGKLPRSLAQLFVHLFNEGELKVLVCTSTLIEGVNTSAANVFVYDKKISTTDFDFFSFANIRGRVGRMMRHYVGNVYLYFEPPEEIETNVDVPILSDPGSSTDYIVANVERDLLSEEGLERRDQLLTRTGIELDVLQEHGSLGTEILIELSKRVQESLSDDTNFLQWKGYPETNQRKHIASLIVPPLIASRHSLGLFTDKQVSWMWQTLQRSKSLGSFLRFFSRTFVRESDGETVSDAVEKAFQFLQACEYTFPNIIMAVEALVNMHSGDETASYGLFVRELENWFKPEWMKQLDEVGIPIPLSERLLDVVGDPDDRHQAMARIFEADLSDEAGFSEIDRFIVQSARGNT